MTNYDDVLEEFKPERPTTVVLRKFILDTLHKNYPDYMYLDPPNNMMHAWIIDIKDFSTGGVVTFRNRWLSTGMGFTLKLHNVQEDPKAATYKIVMNAGELFERFGVAREKGLDIREQIMGIPRNFRGDAIHQV